MRNPIELARLFARIIKSHDRNRQMAAIPARGGAAP